MTPERTYCSDLCLASGEPLLGTAGQVEVWLLLEYKLTWKPKAVQNNDLAAATRAWLDETVAAIKATGRKVRPQFIRRPEIDSTEINLFVARDGRLLRHRSTGYAAIANLDINAAELEDVEQQQYFVCTNGQRDVCCARYGLPTYARLREAVGGRAWQTTHVGGHRFAPNVLALPQGALYGRVFPDAVEDFVRTVENGDLSVSHLRGRAAYPPVAQVAETHIDGDCRLQAVDGERAIFETGAGTRTVQVRRADTPYQVIASCGKSETEAVYPYLLGPSWTGGQPNAR